MSRSQSLRRIARTLPCSGGEGEGPVICVARRTGVKVRELPGGAGLGSLILMQSNLALFAAVIPFAISSAFTPGPNNFMVMASAGNFGWQRTLPHMLGITIGFPLMILGVGSGLAPIFETYPLLHQILKMVGAIYLIYLAWRIAGAGVVVEGEGRGKPITFLQAALFQWVNPKAWIMALGAISTYTTLGGELFVETFIISLVFFFVSFFSTGTWAALGLGARRFIASKRSARIFNWVMAVLLIASLVPLVV